MKTVKNLASLLALLMFSAFALAQVSVSISPTSVTLAPNATKQFSATVTGSASNPWVKWAVDGVVGGSTASGTISTSGLYTAPSTTGTHTVTAISNADPTKSASATVTVAQASQISVTISPTAVTLNPGSTQQFSATVSGSASNPWVKWAVDGVVGGSTTSGTISTSGLYTAPSTAGTHTVTAISNADPTQSASATVTVATSSGVSITISPTTTSVGVSLTRQFTASVSGTTNLGVTWTVDGVAGGNSTTGTITTAGLYTAPATTGQHTVTVTSVADPSKSASASVTVTIAVTIIPTSATVTVSTTRQFSDTVSGTTNTSVTWSVDGIAGGNTTVGTVSTAGLYTAPGSTGSHVITVTSVADPSQSASAQITVATSTAALYVVTTPQSSCIATFGTQQYQATVYNSSNQGVTWSVDNVTAGNSTVGTITSAGLYTAPSAAGSHSIKATSVANTSKASTAQISVNSSVKVWIGPGSTSVPVNSTQQFVANVCATANTGVTWSVDGVAGGSATSGTISNTGLYTAPPSAGSHTIKITSAADSTKSAQVPIYVFDSVTVDFGSRTATSYAIPAGVIGAQLGSLQDSTALATLAQAGLTSMRLYPRIPDVYATTTPDWTKIDPTISKLQAAGLKPLIEMSFTPSWLQPSPNPCATQGVSGMYAAPANVNTWAQLAASYVAHFDQVFPGLVQDYEIWNEPDLPSFCVAGNTPSARLSTYLSLYAAAAPAMRAQAQKDGSTIRIGGPALSNPVGLASTWIPALLSNSGTALYVDFVSYHLYLGGLPQIQMGMTWDTAGITTPLYALTQSPTTGIAGVYKQVAALVKNGSQPNAASTPIYFDEYDDNSAFFQDCCRSDPNYAPVWNALVFSGLLNTVYAGAQNVPAKTAYYAASAPYYFCLLGTINSSMNCVTTVLQPYPQFYAFDLVASPNYLGLQLGGYLAASVYPPIPQVGLAISAFYTTSADSILIVNPTPVDYPSLGVAAQNPGFLSAQATSYLLNSSNSQITTQSLSLSQNTSSVTATIHVPPYSVVGIKITGK